MDSRSLVPEEKFSEAIEILQGASNEFVVIDTETSKVKWREERYLLGIGVLVPDELSIYFPIGHRTWDAELCPGGNIPLSYHEPLRAALSKVIPIWHHGRFDEEQCRGWGINFGHVFKYEYMEGSYTAPAWYDTLIMSFMEDENKFSHELEQLGALVGQQKMSMKSLEKGFGSWELIPPEVMGRYCEKDCLVTWELFKYFYASLDDQGELLDLLPRENRITQIIQKMENAGVGFNVEGAKQLADQTREEIDDILHCLGFDPAKPAQLAHRLYALPPAGLGFRPEAYSKRKSKEFPPGIPIMDDAVLSRLNHPEVEKIRRWRTLSKAQTTWYEGFLEHVSPYDGRLHSTYKQHGARTTRWTSSKPNLNQLPRDVKKTPVRKLLLPAEGHELWEFDYSQQEVRFITIYSEAKFYEEAYRKGEDVHALMAQRIGAYEKFPDQPELGRYCGKQANLGLQYMAGPPTLGVQIYGNSGIELDLKTLKEFHSLYHETLPEIRRFNNQARGAAEIQGFVRMWNKRRRHLDGYDCKKAGNSIIQGGCAQIMFDSMILLDDAEFKTVGQVYDSVWLEIPTDEVEARVPYAQQLMREWVEDLFEFPFPVDAKRLN